MKDGTPSFQRLCNLRSKKRIPWRAYGCCKAAAVANGLASTKIILVAFCSRKLKVVSTPNIRLNNPYNILRHNRPYNPLSRSLDDGSCEGKDSAMEK